MAYKYKALKINGKRIDEHRHVMQLHLGRKLEKNEVVRHKDGNTLNNSIENLYVVTRQQQFQEQLASGNVAKSILDGLERKRLGIKPPSKKKKKAISPKKKTKITSAIVHKPRERKIEKPVEKKHIPTYPLKVNRKTTIYIKVGTPQTEVDKIIKKYA